MGLEEEALAAGRKWFPALNWQALSFGATVSGAQGPFACVTLGCLVSRKWVARVEGTKIRVYAKTPDAACEGARAWMVNQRDWLTTALNSK